MKEFFRQIVRGVKKDIKGFLLRMCVGIGVFWLFRTAKSIASEEMIMEAILVLFGSFLAGLNYGLGKEAIICERTRYDDVAPEKAVPAALADFVLKLGNILAFGFVTFVFASEVRTDSVLLFLQFTAIIACVNGIHDLMFKEKKARLIVVPAVFFLLSVALTNVIGERSIQTLWIYCGISAVLMAAYFFMVFLTYRRQK